MSHEKLLAEWFWIDRWMGSSAFLLPIEPRGLYREMLTQAWRRGAKLPNDHQAIQRAVGVTRKEWDRSWPKVEPYWQVDGGYLVNLTQQQVYADCLAGAERAGTRALKAAQARWEHKPKESTSSSMSTSTRNAQALLEVCPPSPSLSPVRQNKERSDVPRESKSHPVKELLAYHEQCFEARYKAKPAKYTGKDAKHAKDLIDQHGAEKARRIVRQAFVSRDSFLVNSGHSLGTIISSPVQNRIIAELSQVASTTGVPDAEATRQYVAAREGTKTA